MVREKLEQIYSDLAQGRIKFTEIFGPRNTFHSSSPFIKNTIEKNPILYIVDEGYRTGKDDRDLFFKENEVVMDDKDDFHYTPKLEQELPTRVIDKQVDFLPVESNPWEDKIIWDDDSSSAQEITSELPNTKYKRLGMFRNNALNDGDWLEAVVYDDEPRKVAPKTFDDPAITLDVQTIDLNKSIF
jgi:hypothetical protein